MPAVLRQAVLVVGVVVVAGHASKLPFVDWPRAASSVQALVVLLVVVLDLPGVVAFARWTDGFVRRKRGVEPSGKHYVLAQQQTAGLRASVALAEPEGSGHGNVQRSWPQLGCHFATAL